MTTIYKIVLLLILASINSFAQDNQLKLDSKYFILGTIGDYLGYGYIQEDTSYKIITYSSDELYKLYLIDSLLKYQEINNGGQFKYKIEFRGIDQHCDHSTGHLISKDLFDFINSFYRFQIRNSNRYNYDKNGNFKKEGIHICRGKLKYVKLRKLPSDKLNSFFAGAFFDYGENKNDIYSFRMANSLSKMSVLKRILRNENCKISNDTMFRLIPNVHLLTFIPSDKLKLVFDQAKELELKLLHRTNLILEGRKIQ